MKTISFILLLWKIMSAVCSKDIESGTKILCALKIRPSETTNVLSIKNTWGKSCDKLIIISSKEDKGLPTDLVVNQNGEYQKESYLLTFEHIYKYSDSVSWFLVTTADSYVAMDNLRQQLAQRDTNLPLYLVTSGNYGFRSGVVMSEKALEIFVTRCMKSIRNNGISGEKLHPELQIYNSLRDNQVQISNLCDMGFEGYPPGVKELDVAPSFGYTCKNAFFSLSNVGPDKKSQIHEFIQKRKSLNVCNAEVKKAVERVESKLEQSIKVMENKFDELSKLIGSKLKFSDESMKSYIEQSFISLKADTKELIKSELKKIPHFDLKNHAQVGTSSKRVEQKLSTTPRKTSKL